MKLSLFKTEFPIMLAPMAGFTDMTYRSICREHGCDFTFTEMISAKGLKYGGKSADLMETAPNERPCGIQLFGRDPDIMAEMARRICGENKGELALIDINMGCPAPKITGNGEGSALMKNPLLAGKIIEKTAKAIQKPLTVKIRKGFDDAHVNAVEMAKIAQESGAAAVAVHGRTREQYYSGTADWDIIAQVKQAVKIPVIGNGDVVDAASALRLFEQTGCDGIMVGRGAQGNPWIFRQIADAMAGKAAVEPTNEEKFDVLRRHLHALAQLKGGAVAVREMRRHIVCYVRGMRDAARLRVRVNAITDIGEMEEALKAFMLEGKA